MRVLGLDPSSRSTGYGLIDEAGDGYALVAQGTIKPGRGDALEVKLAAIREGVSKIIEDHLPQEVAIENPFFARNARTAITLGQVRGAILVAVAAGRLPLHEYSALEIKKAVTGHGQADKHQVQSMVRALLRLGEQAMEEDAADALAAAICHINSRAFRGALEGAGS